MKSDIRKIPKKQDSGERRRRGGSQRVTHHVDRGGKNSGSLREKHSPSPSLGHRARTVWFP